MSRAGWEVAAKLPEAGCATSCVPAPDATGTWASTSASGAANTTVGAAALLASSLVYQYLGVHALHLPPRDPRSAAQWFNCTTAVVQRSQPVHGAHAAQPLHVQCVSRGIVLHGASDGQASTSPCKNSTMPRPIAQSSTELRKAHRRRGEDSLSRLLTKASTWSTMSRPTHS